MSNKCENIRNKFKLGNFFQVWLLIQDGSVPVQDVIEAKFVSKTEELLFETGEFTYMMNLTEGPGDELCQVGKEKRSTQNVKGTNLVLYHAW